MCVWFIVQTWNVLVVISFINWRSSSKFRRAKSGVPKVWTVYTTKIVGIFMWSSDELTVTWILSLLTHVQHRVTNWNIQHCERQRQSFDMILLPLIPHHSHTIYISLMSVVFSAMTQLTFSSISNCMFRQFHAYLSMYAEFFQNFYFGYLIKKVFCLCKENSV